jgi:hypothetical protein
MWAGAAATVMIVVISALVALGYLERVRGPKLRFTFAMTEPWCREGKAEGASTALWVRVGVENFGHRPARNCVGRLLSVSTKGAMRSDIDPLQLRWAGVPHTRAFAPMDLRRGQREYLNVLCLLDGARWRLVTYDDPDFDPGFLTELPPGTRHVLQVAVLADNARTKSRSLAAEAHIADDDVTLELL